MNTVFSGLWLLIIDPPPYLFILYVHTIYGVNIQMFLNSYKSTHRAETGNRSESPLGIFTNSRASAVSWAKSSLSVSTPFIFMLRCNIFVLFSSPLKPLQLTRMAVCGQWRKLRWESVIRFGHVINWICLICGQNKTSHLGLWYWKKTQCIYLMMKTILICSCTFYHHL